MKEIERQTFLLLQRFANVNLDSYTFLHIYLYLNYVALDCLEDPATGMSAGVETRIWNNNIFYGTTITYECPYGRID